MRPSSSPTPCDCNDRELGYSKQGAIRTATLHNLGLPIGAINLTPFATVKARSTEILVGVECLKTGQTACTADANGNIGTGNKGKDNFGSNNVGDHNIGELGVHTKHTLQAGGRMAVE